jgi:hypothetical protein
MGRWIHILSISLLVALTSVVSAQSPTTCGIVGVDGPPDDLESGTVLVFLVKITNTSNPQLKWTVSAGTINSGQGTEVITVDSTGLGGQEVTATAELIGAPSGCNSSASTKTRLKLPRPPDGCPFDEYGDISFIDEQARLDNFAIQILNYPQSSGQIRMFAGQKTFKREAAYRLNRARSYLVNVRGVDSSRIVTIDCGFATDLSVSLMVVPPGARFLECNNYVQIPLSEVKFTKPRPKSSKRRQ